LTENLLHLCYTDFKAIILGCQRGFGLGGDRSGYLSPLMG